MLYGVCAAAHCPGGSVDPLMLLLVWLGLACVGVIVFARAQAQAQEGKDD